MSTFGDKLTAGLRQLKEGASPVPPAPSASVPTAAPAVTKASVAAAPRSAPAAKPGPAPDDNRSPTITSDDLWKHLHPRRVWPD